MDIAAIFLLAISVSMDAFAVSMCKGLAVKKAGLRQCLTCGIWFGGFQALMPLIGFFLGTLFADAIQAVVMVIATVTILIGALAKGGGSAALVDIIAAEIR